MRPNIQSVIREKGLVGVIKFFQTYGKSGINLSLDETKALAEFLEKFVVPPSKGE